MRLDVFEPHAGVAEPRARCQSKRLEHAEPRALVRANQLEMVELREHRLSTIGPRPSLDRNNGLKRDSLLAATLLACGSRALSFGRDANKSTQRLVDGNRIRKYLGDIWG